MSTNRRRIRKLLSFVLIGAGMVLLFLGGRDWLDSHLGQNKAQSEFDETVSARLSPFGSGSAAEPRIAPGDAVAKLTIPRLHTELYVVEGDGASELRRGPGHVTGTVMPGQPGNCIIAGHRDTHFRVLKDIRSGDQIVLQTKSGEYRYQVSGTHVVSPSNTASLKPTQDAELHLITCYPFYYLGSAPRRFIVQAQLLAPVIGR